MESRTEELSLVDALSESRTTQLNKEWDGKRTWLKAIIKVEKCDTSRNYAVAENDGTGKPHILRDFGNCASIVRVLAIYPTYYLSENQKPDLRNKKDITTYLVGAGYGKDEVEALLATTDADGNAKTEEQLKADKEIIKEHVNTVAIKEQLLLMNSRR